MRSVILRRRIADAVALVFAGAATLFGLFWLVWILWTTISFGAAALTPALVTERSGLRAKRLEFPEKSGRRSGPVKGGNDDGQRALPKSKQEARKPPIHHAVTGVN